MMNKSVNVGHSAVCLAWAWQQPQHLPRYLGRLEAEQLQVEELCWRLDKHLLHV